MKFLRLAQILIPLLWSAVFCHAQEAGQSWLDTLAENVFETGVSRDQILSLDRPSYITIPDACLFMDREDIVFLHESPDGPIIYPRNILVWRQIVNGEAGGNPVSITHDPVTGGLVGFQGSVGRFKTGFGVYGPVVNNNLILYDRSTLSLWPQLLGQAMDGSLKKERLEPFTLLWTTWDRASKRYPGARVLTRPTTGSYAYGRDPYGSYHRPDSYYQNEQIVYPLVHPLDTRLHPKETILGLHDSGYALAVRLSAVEQEGAVNFQAGFRQLVALYDHRLGDARIFERTAKDQTLTFFAHDKDEFYDQETHSMWNSQGEALLGPLADEKLVEVPRFRAMWFAWSAMNPGSILVPDPGSGNLPAQHP